MDRRTTFSGVGAPSSASQVKTNGGNSGYVETDVFVPATNFFADLQSTTAMSNSGMAFSSSPTHVSRHIHEAVYSTPYSRVRKRL
jgi:hypothetical protein